jgi:sigma-B regulation protein RsbU (phosphoserine phosphatase)
VLPDESGYEICSHLKSDPETADIPVIFLSALNDVASRVKGLKIGAVDFISKPVHPEELLARVRVHLRIREVNRLARSGNQRRIEALRHAQRSILVRPEQLCEAHFEVCYLPLEEASGDFYDVVKIDPDVFGYFVADVSGHGAGAAFITSALKALLRQYSGPLYSPEDTMRGINSVVSHVLSEEQYLTACYARLNLRTRTLSVISAGHPPMIRVKADGEAEVVHGEGDAVGLFHTLVLHCREVRVQAGDRFFLYTDGLIETEPGANRDQGSAHLLKACIRHQEAPLKEAVSAITSETLYPRETALDDVLLLGFEVRP